MANRWQREFTDATGLIYGLITVSPGDEAFPAMVELEVDEGGLLDYDADELGLLIQEAAQEAKRQNTARQAPPKPQPIPTHSKGRRDGR